MTMRGLTKRRRCCALWMNSRSMISVIWKSAITPSLSGRTAVMLSGVLPSIAFASLPTATTRWLWLSRATTEGSFRTIPLPRTYTSVFAVPRSMATSLENQLEIDLNMVPSASALPPVGPRSPVRCQVSSFPQALVRSVPKDQVIEQSDPDQHAALLQSPREFQILRARRRDPRRVVVRDDQRRGARLDRGLQHLARMHDGGRQRSDRHRDHVDHLVLGRQEHRDEVLAIGIAQRGADHARYVGGSLHAPALDRSA